jgi:hypothetical protein
MEGGNTMHLTPEQERQLRSWCDTKTEELLDALRDLRKRPSVETARHVMLVSRTVGRVSADLVAGMPPRNLTLPGV